MLADMRALSALLTATCLIAASITHAQDDTETKPTQTQPTEAAPAPVSSVGNDYVIGAMPEDPRGEYYESPLKKIGTDLFLAPYVIGAMAALIYLAVVYPVQALVGSSHVEGVMPWLLVPVLGPFMAQYTRHVKDEPGWRGVLIGDAALQATGAILGLLGEALSGWRELPPRSKAGLDLHFAMAGRGSAVLSVTWRTL